MAEVLRNILMYAALPLWSLAGLADWWPADWGWRAKAEPLPAGYLAGGLLLVFLFNVLPLLEEFWRCWRVRAQVRLHRMAG